MPRPTVPSVESLRPSGALAFLQPTDEPSDPSSPSDPLAATETSPSDPPDPWLSSTEETSGPLEDDEPERRSSTASRAGSALSKRTLRDAIRHGVLMAGSIAHQVLARQEAQQRVGLYLADEDDAQAIGDPVTNIVHRHGGIGAAGNPDLADAIAAMIGLALYGTKQLARFAEARMLAAEQRPVQEQPPADEAQL